ncbi:hypothetical protein A9X03_04470 [Mycobacterium sp. E1715]|uniref:hypothetical protein n=2 Tax=Mycobacterium TaxID=1763 RepID=UPI0007FBE145|nr:hypothetical protein A5703_05920 [Mycobacterium sp. E188]OBG80436.1 hypothetical protein A9X05_20730 [Mycobacterium sp. E3298]OBH09365.1 hypothetical protein A9X03_04470 [Mycobacterium sp. E1715]OBH36267.1 hypothetical protein A5691_04800 [Mycobacterium sp. E183]
MGSVAGRRPHAGGMKKLSVLVDRVRSARRRGGGDRAVGVGTVRAVERQVFIEVVAVSGETFIGKLARCGDDLDLSVLRPGLVVLVAFDPAARESLSLPDDVLAVHAAWVASL